MYGPGAQSDQMLFFKPDGSGRYEELNWTLIGVEHFEWQLLSPGMLRLIGTRSESRDKHGNVIEEAGAFNFPELECSIGEEDTPSGNRMRVLRLKLCDYISDHFGFVRANFDGAEEAEWD